MSKFEVLRATYQEQMKEYLAKGGGGAAGGDAPVRFVLTMNFS